MSKRGNYLGGHSQVGSTVGFAGWGAKSKRSAGVGLAGMAPASDPSNDKVIAREDVPQKVVDKFAARAARRQRKASKSKAPLA